MVSFRILITVVLVAGLFAGCASTSVETQDAEATKPQPAGEKEEQPAADTEETVAKEPIKNSLKWTTASEVDNFGFDIYRATSEEGPFTRMTEEPLAGAGTTDEPQPYEWYDFDIQSGVDYFYYIESISMAGDRERFSPIIKAPAKD